MPTPKEFVTSDRVNVS